MDGQPRVPRTDAIDGYSPTNGVPQSERDLLAALGQKVRPQNGEGPFASRGALFDALQLSISAHADGTYLNALTGVGDPSRDKTFGGHWNGPHFVNQHLTGWEAQERWRGSDLGARVVETHAREMIRKGWKIDIQPEPDDKTPRGDEFPEQPTAPTHTPGPLPQSSDDNTAILEALNQEQDQLGLLAAIEQALCYERCYGGGAVLIGVDDGETDLTKPLDPKKVRRITHLTAFRGGWDGELIAWRYYCDPRLPKFGEPEIYQLRNLGVPIAGPAAPGETGVSSVQPLPSGSVGALIFYVHESRFLIFDGSPTSRWAQVQMRGWGDGIWMRINEVLSQYSQSWNGVAIQLQELGAPILKMKGFSGFMAAQDGTGQQIITNRAIAMAMAMSIAKTRILDSEESLERLKTDLAGVADVLREFALRLSAAAGMPFSMLMGQVQGGLGDASKGDISFFDDVISGLITKKLLPEVKRFITLQFAAQQGPTKGQTPKRWDVTTGGQREMTPQERAKRYLDIATADEKYIQAGVFLPEEVASTRCGQSGEFNDGPIVIDFQTREAMKAKDPVEPPPDDEPAPHGDADLISRKGSLKVRRAESKVAVFRTGDGFMLWGKDAAGKYSLPGGTQEPGEDANSCAVRQLFEKTGLHARQLKFADSLILGKGLTQVKLSVFRAVVAKDARPTPANDPNKTFVSFEWFDVTNGYPEELHNNQLDPDDVAGKRLLRLAR